MLFQYLIPFFCVCIHLDNKEFYFCFRFAEEENKKTDHKITIFGSVQSETDKMRARERDQLTHGPR